jgi:hypothetical protein
VGHNYTRTFPQNSFQFLKCLSRALIGKNEDGSYHIMRRVFKALIACHGCLRARKLRKRSSLALFHLTRSATGLVLL